MLDLTFLATGFRQHVFTRTEGDDGWVYKVPVAFGRVLPFDARRVEASRPRGAVRRLAHSILVRGPGTACDRLERSAESLGRGRVVGNVLHHAARVAGGVRDLRDRALIAVLIHRRLAEFRSMLATLSHLSAEGADHVVLPFRLIPSGEAVLRVGPDAVPYSGPIFVQRRAEIFRVTERSLRSYDWGDLVAAQHLLWSYGVGLVETGEILGPRSWTILEGRLYLVDTSSLTRSRNLARRSLSPEQLDDRERIIEKRLREEGSTFPIDEYFRAVRFAIHQEAFDRLWRSAIRTGARSGG